MKIFLEKELYRCNKKHCRTKLSLYGGTIFEKMHICLPEALKVIYEWSVRTPVTTAAATLGMPHSTLSNWYSRMRQLATIFYFSAAECRIGGEGVEVEIDESKFSKNKYGRGRRLASQIWGFAGVVRGSREEYFMEFVESRNRQTLIDVISRRIRPGSIIYSDCWKAYENLPELLPEFNFQHKRVNHSRNFVDQDDRRTHTQSIEAFWSVIKRSFRRHCGTNYASCLDEFMGEFMYRRMFGKFCFSAFMGHVGNNVIFDQSR